MTQSFEEEVKNPENNIYCADNPVALHDNLDAPLRKLTYNGLLLGIQAFLCLSHWSYQLLRNSNSGLV